MRIILPKGRLFSPALKLLSRVMELQLPEAHVLISPDGRVLVARAMDVPVYVEHGIDVGIAGSDAVEERNSDVFVPLELPFGRCRLSVAVPVDKRVEVEDMDGFRVATKYSNITRRFFRKMKVDVEVMKLHGSVELSAHIGVADAIVEIVDTASTLRAHNLVEIAKIMDVSALLIVNRISQKVKFEEINALLRALRREINGA